MIYKENRYRKAFGWGLRGFASLVNVPPVYCKRAGDTKRDGTTPRHTPARGTSAERVSETPTEKHLKAASPTSRRKVLLSSSSDLFLAPGREANLGPVVSVGSGQ